MQCVIVSPHIVVGATLSLTKRAVAAFANGISSQFGRNCTENNNFNEKLNFQRNRYTFYCWVRYRVAWTCVRLLQLAASPEA